MKLALFGATRGVGKQILLQAIERGHSVRALVRDPSKLDVVQGDVLNANQVTAMLHSWRWAANQGKRRLVLARWAPKIFCKA